MAASYEMGKVKRITR